MGSLEETPFCMLVPIKGRMSANSLQTTARFMIDVTTFKQEAPSDHPFVAKKLINSFSEEFLRNPVPPEDKLLLMPSTLVGYSMEDKSWCKLVTMTIYSNKILIQWLI